MPNNYREALEYLYSLTNYEIKSTFAYAPQFFDLARVERLLHALGDPHHQFKSIHIAGTKGKGSTCAMLASILQAAGFRTGLYTKPHLHSFRERIQVDNQLIHETDVAALVEQLRPIADRDKELTTFEVATALAFVYFARAQVDIAVVEAGLGGRLDATNVIVPMVSVITKIGHDHMHILGNTLAQIAAEKAGIIKDHVPLVTGPQDDSVLRVIHKVSAEKSTPFHAVGQEWQWRATDYNLQGQRFTLSRRNSGPCPQPYRSLREVFIPLLGRHQLRNAAVVLATIDVLRGSGVNVTESAIRSGLRSVIWPARFEVMGKRPYFVVDGAHNVDSARCLANTLDQYFPGLKPSFVLAVLSDKDIPAVLKPLLPRAKSVIFSRSHHLRAADPFQLQHVAAGYNVPTAVIEDVSRATLKALTEAGPKGLVVAAGSFSTAGEAREAWLRLHRCPLPPLDPI